MAMKAQPLEYPVHRRRHPCLESIDALVDQPADEDAAWLVTLRKRLDELSDALERHYAAEEEGDLYGLVPRQHPRFRQALVRLLAEHDGIRSALGELSQATHAAAAKPWLGARVRLQAKLLVARIRRHEAREDEILLEAALEDLRSEAPDPATP